MYGFMQRHQNISLRSPEATSVARVCGFNRKVGCEFYDIWRNIVCEKSLRLIPYLITMRQVAPLFRMCQGSCSKGHEASWTDNGDRTRNTRNSWMLHKCFWSFASSRIGVSTCQLQEPFYMRSPSRDAWPGQPKWLDDYGTFSENLDTHHQAHRLYKRKASCIIDGQSRKSFKSGSCGNGSGQQIIHLYFAFVTRHPLTSQYSSSGVIEGLNDLYLDLKST